MNLEQMMSDMLDAMLSIFNCDRAWLVYPCDPEAASWKVPMEHARPEFPGLFVLGLDLPVDPENRESVPNGQGVQRPCAIRSGIGTSAAGRGGEAFQHTVYDRHGGLSQRG